MYRRRYGRMKIGAFETIFKTERTDACRAAGITGYITRNKSYPYNPAPSVAKQKLCFSFWLCALLSYLCKEIKMRGGFL